MSDLKTRWKHILLIAWPLIVANSFWNLQLTIDRIFLGNYSTEALGAAMAVMGVFWVPMALLQQTASYVTTFVAQYFGAQEYERIASYLWQAIHVSLIGGLIFIGFSWFSPTLFGWMGHSPPLQLLEIQYFNALTYSALPTALMAAISGFFIGLGQTRTVIGINLVGMLLNVLFDYLLIFGNWGAPALGIEGAGYATALANYGAAAYGVALLAYSKFEYAFNFKNTWKLKWRETRQFLKFGIPSGMQWALEGLAFTLFLVVMGHMKNGEAALASSSIAVTVMMLSVLPSMGIAQAVLTLVGQSLGEKDPQKATQVTWDGVRITAIYISCMALTFFLIPDFYLSWFENQSNPELWSRVRELSVTLLMIVGVFTIFDSLYLNISFALKGAGDTRFVSLVALTVPWPIMVLPAYLVRHWDNAPIIAWGFAALYGFTINTILVWRFRQGKWKTMTVMN